MRQTLRIKERLPDLNSYILAERANKYIASGLKKRWTDYVAGQCKAQKIFDMKMPIAAIFTWYVRDNRRDKDNIMFGQKFVFDGLMKAGVIPNDGFKDISDIYHFFYVAQDGEEECVVDLYTADTKIDLTITQVTTL